MKILQILNYPGQGGTEQYAYTIAKYALENGHEVSFIFGGQGPLVERVRELGCKVIFVEMPSFYNLRSLKEIVKIFKDLKPDVVLTHFLRENFLAIEASKFAPVKGVFSVVHRIEPKTKMQAIFNKTYSKGITKFIATSILAKEYLLKEGIREEKINVILNGVDLGKVDKEKIREELGIDSGKLISYVGRFTKEKGHKIILDAFNNANITDTKLVLVGDGEMLGEIKKYTKELGVKNVIFTGGREKGYEIIGISDLYIQPSLIETMPLTVLEAMILGTPMILSDIEAHELISQHGKFSLMFQSGKFEDLAKKIEEAFSEYAVAESKAKVARDFALKNYTADKMWKETEAVFKKS